ncbi:hypothetical protein CIT292_06652 [Citrobacter youngae ATCC 29220]|uniref:Uncharacterized protein n=1 Tax=Citrobacter youngae ATCC 29220 TaxID=500640 RepID=D4B873_9ENTR|nr:hypothetical protein CIT292_06652 [Citrobacter youngae ATCC 29220]
MHCCLSMLYELSYGPQGNRKRSSQQTDAGVQRRVDGDYSSITDLLTVNEMRLRGRY